MVGNFSKDAGINNQMTPPPPTPPSIHPPPSSDYGPHGFIIAEPFERLADAVFHDVDCVCDVGVGGREGIGGTSGSKRGSM
jgi:hypothetical protein